MVVQTDKDLRRSQIYSRPIEQYINEVYVCVCVLYAPSFSLGYIYGQGTAVDILRDRGGSRSDQMQKGSVALRLAIELIRLITSCFVCKIQD